ncbi:hypothetical protein M9435_005028 [Picochlorum sp. BPE23]|nr:hypothetical protein M9435_005028 [Picochlorum sp. BPE23]
MRKHCSICALLVTLLGLAQANLSAAMDLRSPGVMSLDWSYAGRAAGSDDYAYIPSKRIDIRDFGARIDGVTDDSRAIQDAIDNCEFSGGGVVELPPGTILLEDQITISSSNIILRGAGKNETIIKIPHSLKYYDLQAGTDDDTYSRSKGFIQIKGRRIRSGRGSTYATDVVSNAKAGYRALQVRDTSKFYTGQWVRLYMSDPKSGPVKSSLLGNMYYNPNRRHDCGEDCLWRLQGHKDMVRFMSKISEVRYNEIVLERELPVDVRTTWKPRIHIVDKYDVPQNCGVQGFTVDFRWIRSKEHLNEAGHNAIVLEETAFSWVRDVAVVNADLNFVIRYSNFVSVTEVEARVTKDRSNKKSKGKQGHIAIGIHDSCDVYVSEFDVQDTWWHDLSVRASMLSVFRNGKGADINMDLHKSAPYMILYTDIYLGKGTRAFTTGGKSGTGMPSAGYTTFWNIRKEGGEPIELPGCSYGPYLNFVGNFEGKRCQGHTLRKDEETYPKDLFVAQIKRRRKRLALK